MKRPTVALAIIVKNEESNLPRLLESVSGCFDEIHVTDTGSTDRTVEIARAFGARVHNFEWCDDFSRARNASFEPVTTDYVCWLDADDVLENPEGFKKFRDDVMGLSDYHAAAYHYASDDIGKATCTFVRERVVRVSRKFKWKYPIHEGITPDSATDAGTVKVNYSPSWAVRHMRTEADVQKDRGRNLGIFEKMKAKGALDSRMSYYYGKELFEAQRADEAISVLGGACSKPDLEPHDRILAYQFLLYALIQKERYDVALQIGFTALQLAPQRAEILCVIADCLVKMNRPADAIPYYSAAQACQTGVPAGFAAPVFFHDACYSHYPLNQKARILANLGDLSGAEKAASEAAAKHGDPESKSILAEVIRIRDLTLGFKNAKDCEDIVITTAPMTAYEFDPAIAESKAMGGSETALIEMAKHLKRLSGRPVKVFNMRQTDGVFKGVEYISNQKVNEYFSANKPYAHIAWRHNLKLTDAPTFVWCHDLQTPGIEQSDAYVKAFALTPFHSRYMQATQMVPESKIYVTRNGIIPERFEDKLPKEPLRFVYGSSPDRGLDRAMRVLDRVRARGFTDVTLHVHYGIEHLHRYGLGALAEKLKAMFAERPWVKYHGATQQDELMDSYKRSAYCVQPSDWIETSMISAMELTACGVYPIMRRIGGVADTLAQAEAAGMATLVDSDCITDEQHDLYADAVVSAIEREAYKKVILAPGAFSWAHIAYEWLEDLPKMIAAQEGYGKTA